MPDLLVTLDITAEESFRRLKNEDNGSQSLVYEKQGLAFMKNLRRGYQMYIKGYQDGSGVSITPLARSFTMLDGMRDKMEVHRDIVRLVEGARAKNLPT
jgi:thymidylate kinase